MSLEPLSEGELAKKYPRRGELLKALGLNILKGYPNSLANNIKIPELEECQECNNEIFINPPKAFITLVCGHVLHHDCFEKSNKNMQKICPVCFVDEETTLSENQDVQMTEASEATEETEVPEIEKVSTKSSESDKVQGLIKELSMPSDPIDDKDRENKSKETKPKTLLQLYYNASRAEKHVTRAYQEEIRCWYLFAEKFEERVKEIKKDNSRFNDQQARGLVYGEISTNLPGFTREGLRKKTAKARNIYKLFGGSYDSDTRAIIKGIGIEKIERIRTYSADYISKLNSTQIYSIIGYFNQEVSLR